MQFPTQDELIEMALAHQAALDADAQIVPQNFLDDLEAEIDGEIAAAEQAQLEYAQWMAEMEAQDAQWEQEVALPWSPTYSDTSNHPGSRPIIEELSPWVSDSVQPNCWSRDRTLQ